MGQGPAVHLDGAGPEVAVQHLLHVVLQQAVGFEQIGQSTVLAAVTLLRAVDRLVNADALVPGQLTGQLQQALEPLLVGGAPDQGAHNDGSHVDHGVDMSAVQGLVPGVDGVKGLAGGFHAHPALHQLHAVVQQGLEQKDGLDHALDGKGLVAVPGPAVLPLAADDVDPQGVRVGLRQLRDVVRHPPLGGKVEALLQQSLQKFFHVSSRLFNEMTHPEEQQSAADKKPPFSLFAIPQARQKYPVVYSTKIAVCPPPVNRMRPIFLRAAARRRTEGIHTLLSEGKRCILRAVKPPKREVLLWTSV